MTDYTSEEKSAMTIATDLWTTSREHMTTAMAGKAPTHRPLENWVEAAYWVAIAFNSPLDELKPTPTERNEIFARLIDEFRPKEVVA